MNGRNIEQRHALADANSAAVRFIGARHTEQLTSVSRWTLWRWEREGKFPKSLKLESKRAWIESEVLAWMRERIAERGGTAA